MMPYTDLKSSLLKGFALLNLLPCVKRHEPPLVGIFSHPSSELFNFLMWLKCRRILSKIHQKTMEFHFIFFSTTLHIKQIFNR